MPVRSTQLDGKFIWCTGRTVYQDGKFINIGYPPGLDRSDVHPQEV